MMWLPFLALLVSPAMSREKYLCVADQSTGFKWDGSNWVVSKFKADEKYIVREVEEYDGPNGKVNYEVVELGQKSPKHHCFSDHPEKTPSPSWLPKVGVRMP